VVIKPVGRSFGGCLTLLGDCAGSLCCPS
jgi:hypothetical protein